MIFLNAMPLNALSLFLPTIINQVSIFGASAAFTNDVYRTATLAWYAFPATNLPGNQTDDRV